MNVGNLPQIPRDEIEAQFRAFMRENNCEPVDNITLNMDDKIERFRVISDKRSETTGAYRISLEGWPHGWCQNWREGKAVTWTFNRDNIKNSELKNSLTDDALKQMIEKSKAHQAEMIKQLEQSQLEASEKAKLLFESLKTAENSGQAYLKEKQIKSYGLKLQENNLVVPLYDINGNFKSIQFISPDGTKKFFPEAPIKGAFFSIAKDILKPEKAKELVIIICEGMATGATIYEMTSMPTFAAMNCGNLFEVAKGLKEKYPQFKIVIAADNDHKTKGNPGLTTANEVCKRLKLNGVVFPVFTENDTGTDWNDYLEQHGEDKTREDLMSQIRDKYFTKAEKEEIKIREKLRSLVSELNPSIQLGQQEFIGGMFPRKFLSALVAPSGIGKTMFMQKFSSDLSVGGSIFDGFIENEPPRMCLIFAGEAGYEMMVRRGAQTKWRIHPARVKVADQYKFESDGTSIMLDDTEGWKNICRIVDMYKPDIIFFDSLVSFHEKDENKSSEMKPIFKRLNDLARNFNCAVVIIHHSRKRAAKERTLSLNQDDVIGSSVLNRIVGLIIGIEPMKEDERTLLVRPLKTWFSSFMPFTYRITEDFEGNTIMETDLAPATVNNSRIAVWNYLISAFEVDEWFSIQQIELGEINSPVTARQIRTILNEFVKNGKLEKRGETKGSEYCIKDFRRSGL